MSNQPRNSFGEWIADESMRHTQMATLEVRRREQQAAMVAAGLEGRTPYHWSTMPGLPWCRGRDGALPWTADSLVTGIREAEDLVDCPACRAGFLSWLERSERDVGRHVREHSQARGYPCGDVEPRASRSGFVRAAFSGFSRIT